MTDRRDTEPKLDEKRIRSALDDILASDTFSRSPKVSRLLGYLVECRLAGDEDGLKEAQIAQNVFNQPDEFNPRANPIVRVNASRLRNLLRLYYSGPGEEDKLRIMLPDVGYRPDFPGVQGEREPVSARNGKSTPLSTAASSSPTTAHAAGKDAPGGENTGQGRQVASASRDARQSAGGFDAGTTIPPGLARTSRSGMNFGRQGVLALVLANLMLAGAFAVMVGRDDEPSMRHVLTFPVQENTDAPDIGRGPGNPLLMLCNRNAPHGHVSRKALAVAIGENNFMCWPVQLKQAELPRNPV